MTNKEIRLKQKISVIGAGSWGTALAIHCARLGLDVTIWARKLEIAEQINSEHANKTFLPDINLPHNIRAVNSMEDALKDQEIVLVVVPSHGLRDIAGKMAPYLENETRVISASKGIEDNTSYTMAQILLEELPADKNLVVGALSGPSFAQEVAKGLPTALTLAVDKSEHAGALQRFLSSPIFRIYTSSDLVGVELGGALKNVYAIATGICDGLEKGLNARAAILTRAIAEMSRMATAMGANPLTLMGLSGMGDLVLTATGDLSRNRKVGLRLGRGEKLSDILHGSREVAEGIRNAKSVYHLANKYNVKMPMAKEVYKVLYEDKQAQRAVIDLLTRTLKDELDPQHQSIKFLEQ